MAEPESDTARQAVRRPIARLDPDVVNRIAAGEIIHRPSNALKELLENSLDAGATQIKITLQDGGLKLLQIQDNGKGIPVDDMPLLCERFATSKLRSYEDLANMATFGFRGEALASISFVSASVTAVSKTRDEDIAYRASYFAGELLPPAPGQAAEPKPCAGTDGTTITAQDLFFNAPQRKKVFKSLSDEYNRALDVATKYAIHYGHMGVGISCKKSLDLNTPSDPKQTTLDVIRHVHGATLARDLMHLDTLQSDTFGCTVEGWVSNANWASKKTTFLCFINNRLVDCPSLKRSLESMYALLLPKGRHPWMYLALSIAPDRIDVNVHPTKQEVHFLDEDEIVEWITLRVQDLVSQHSSCRVYSTQRTSAMGVTTSEQTVQVLGPRHDRADPRHLVRVDHQAQSLDAMLSKPDTAKTQTERIAESACELTSIQELRQTIVDDRHVGLTEVVQNHKFVGVVDREQALSLLQHGTQLYLVRHSAVIEAFAYQLALRQFAAYTPVTLDPAPSLAELIGLGYDAEDADDEKAALGLSRDQVVAKIYDTLMERAEMLEEYFAIRLNAENGTVETLPALLPRHGALGLSLERLPALFFRLGPQVDWTDEKSCLDGVCRELAYAHVPSPRPVAESDDAWAIQHVWFANLLASRGRMIVPKSLEDNDFVQVASLPDLYRVFERC